MQYDGDAKMRNLKLIYTVVAGVALLGILAPMTSGQTTSTWIGPGSGDWSVGSNWDTGNVPGNDGAGLESAIVGAPSPAELNVNVNLASLLVELDGTVVIEPSRILGFSGMDANSLTNFGTISVMNAGDFDFQGNVMNSGAITSNSVGSFTDIEIQAGGATLSGGGTITLSGTQNARLIGLDSVLTVDDQTIEGQGQLGVNSLAMEFGADTMVDANVMDQTLTVDGDVALNVDGFGTINDGTMRASNGGILVFANDTIDNRNGVIEALANSTVRLANLSTIEGGLVRSLAGGQVELPVSTNTFLSDLTLDADLQSLNASDLGFEGAIENLGSISVNSTGSFTDIEIQAGGAEFLGPGMINMSGQNARIIGLNVPSEAVFRNQIIQGEGQIGANSVALDFRIDTIVDANVPGGRLTIDGNSDLGIGGIGTEIDGLMRASNGGILRFQNDIINNRDGEILAMAGSIVELGNLTDICNGIISSVDDGQIVVPVSQNAFLRNLPTPPFDFELTLDADVRALNASDLGIEGTVNNLGTILVDSTGSFTDIEIQAGGATIAGPGTVTLSGTNARFSGAAPFSFEYGTLTGNGQVVVDSTFDGAIISPGLSIGSLRFVNSDSVFTGGTTIRHEIQSVVDNPGITADVIDVTGQLDLSEVTIDLVSLDVHGDPGEVADFDPNTDYEFVVAIANEIVNFNSSCADFSEFANSFEGSFVAAVVPRGSRQALVLQTSDVVRGDVNQDGAINLLDVAPFVEAISLGNFVPEADVNCDGDVNLLDVDPFIVLLNGG